MDSELHKAAMSRDERSFDNLTRTQDSSHIQQTCQGNSILHLAAMYGNKLTVERILLSNPSLVHQTNLKGDTPLHIAARLGHLEVAELLARYGKRPETVVEVEKKALQMVNLENNTALHEAVKNGHCGIVELLVKEDPSLTSFINDKGESPLFLAVDRDFYEMSLHMLENVGSDCSWSGRNGMTVMHAAVIRIHDNIVSKILTTYGHEILEKQDDLGWLPLHYAAHFGNVEVVNLFLQTKKSLAYVKNNDGMSALHISAKNGCVKVIETLVQECPDVCELLDDTNRTALHVAVESEKAHVVRLFLNMVLFIDQINAKDIEGNTCLHLAAARENVEILLMLANNSRVEKGAINNVGMTAVDICGSTVQLKDNGKVMIASALFRKGTMPSLERAVIKVTSTEHIVGSDGASKDIVGSDSDGASKDIVGSDGASKDIVGSDSDGASKDIVGSDGASKDIVANEHLKNMVDVNLLIATILISISFAAGMQMPGGYDEKGMAILRNKHSFKSFLVFNSLAFGCSAASMLFHYTASLLSRLSRKSSTFSLYFVMILTDLSIFSTVVAYIAGTDSVLKQKESNSRFSLAFMFRKQFQIVGLAGNVAEFSFIIPVSCLFYWSTKHITSYIRKLLHI
ncbi:hypothetical protein UlMin_006214 [Ulmus minor]